tara:strand:+ start:2635 stop:2856 length:222 start_codon:yes stop_codon:yes gene_type:complete
LSIYHVVFTHDRDGEVARTTCVIDSPKSPSFKFWDEEDIGDEVYWKIESVNGYAYVRKSFLCSITIEKEQEVA